MLSFRRRGLAARRLRGWSLRGRLVATLLGLLAVVSVSFGIVTQVAMSRQLTSQLDARLAAASSRSYGALGGPRPDGSPGGNELSPTDASFLTTPGQPVGTLGARIVGGAVTQADTLTSATGSAAGSTAIGTQAQTSPVAVPAADYPVLTAVPHDGHARTRMLSTLGRYRLLAVTEPDGDVLVTGLPLADVTAALDQLAEVELAVGLVGLGLAGAAGTIIVRRALRPLRRVAATATRVARLPLQEGEVALAERVGAHDADARTEVGQVGAALNRLLGHVASALEVRHSSEVRLRQFVADASHELRTPLASIRGYAELTRASRADAPPLVSHALGRVESEAIRMTSLVDDLLLLARLDSGRPLQMSVVDISVLVIDTVTDAHAAGPLHTWKLDLPDESVRLMGDRARLHQVLANLLANARTHTPPGTNVTVSVRRTDAGMAELSVIDDGPGIPPDLLPTVFERFARGDTSRSRTAGSTGLGLAIVEAVVEAHGGDIAVTSEPGRTAFTVLLPMTEVAASTDTVQTASSHGAHRNGTTSS